MSGYGNLPAATLERIADGRLPVLARDPEASLILDRCMSASQRLGGVLHLVNMPSDNQRRILMNRYKAIMTALEDQDRKAVAQAVVSLLGCYRNGIRQDEDAKSVAAKYVAELKGIPTWAVLRAVDAIKDNQTDVNPNHPPSTIKVREIADSYVKTMRLEAVQIAEVLKAREAPREVPVEVRKQVGRAMGELAAELRDRLERDGAGHLPPPPKTEGMKRCEQFYVQRETAPESETAPIDNDFR